MRQIFYIRPHEDRSWVVSRFGQPLVVAEDPADAIKIGNRLARKASSAGCSAELRLAHKDRSYDLCSVFEDGLGPDL